MIPPIGLVRSVEMIRDGGSLAAIFQGTDGCDYWVCLPIVLQNDAVSGASQRIGYDPPLIVDRLADRDIPISWQQAQVFLSQVRPFLERKWDLHWFEIMSETVRLRGALPSGVNPNFG